MSTDHSNSWDRLVRHFTSTNEFPKIKLGTEYLAIFTNNGGGTQVGITNDLTLELMESGQKLLTVQFDYIANVEIQSDEGVEKYVIATGTEAKPALMKFQIRRFRDFDQKVQTGNKMKKIRKTKFKLVDPKEILVLSRNKDDFLRFHREVLNNPLYK